MKFSLLTSISLLALLDSYISKHVRHEFVVEHNQMAPANFELEGYTINKQFPAPLLNITKGDSVTIKVINRLKTDFSIHWHGILQKGTPYSDGVPMITQEPIKPGDSYTYHFDCSEQSGTHWYHAHTRFDGEHAFGGLIIQEDAQEWKEILEHEPRYKYDEERLLIISELWHKEVNKIYSDAVGIPFRGPGESDITLFNGRSYKVWGDNGKDNSTVPFNLGYEAINVDPGKTYRLRVVGALGADKMNFTIAGHKFTVIEQDGTYLEPVEVDHLEIFGGQRISVLFKTDQPVGNYMMSARRTVRVSPRSHSGRGYLHYNGANALTTELKTEIKLNEPISSPDRWIENRMFTSDVYKKIKSTHYRPVPKKVNKHIYLKVNQNTTVHPEGAEVFQTINYVRNPKRTQSVLQTIYDGTYKQDHEIHEVEEGDAVQIVMEHVVPKSFGSCQYHPWHLHGHAFHVVANGKSLYNHDIDGPKIDASVASATKLPLFVDTFTHYNQFAKYAPTISSSQSLNNFVDYRLRNSNSRIEEEVINCGWYAIRFIADNPGAWYMHCHITLHMALGKTLIINVKPKDQQAFNNNFNQGKVRALTDRF